ncbi:MAG: ABC transporter ATP-binding protein [Myxococcales bacterium]|nr:ABC transporter ATP-binding protein [Myxococcales bacterium]
MSEAVPEVLRLERCTRRFGSRVALLDATLSLRPGLVGLLGPNGAGKTTFLRLAAGLIGPTSGTVSWLGGHQRRDPALANAISMASDGDQLPVSDTAQEFVAMLLQCAGLTGDQADERAEQVLRRLGLAEKLDAPISTLSRGQRQRVKLAQALALPASLVLLDEPLNGLDPVWRMEVATLMNEAAERGACVIVSSHILEEVEAICERLVLLYRGRVVASGTQAEIRSLLSTRGTAVRVSTDQPRELARALLVDAEISALQFEPGAVIAHASQLAAVHSALPAAIVSSGAKIAEIETQGDDLVSLFAALGEEMR